MIYSNTDIILCFAGIGRTFFSEQSTFTLDRDFKSGGDSDVKKFVEWMILTKNTRKYRYILIPLNEEIGSELSARGIKYIVAIPNPSDWNAWASRWMKSGATAEQLTERSEEWSKFFIENAHIRKFIAPTVKLKPDEWLGNILCQSNEPKAME